MLHDPLANALSSVKNYEVSGKNTCTIEPASRLIQSVLEVMKANKYLGKISRVEDGKSGKLEVELAGRINNCGVIKPRYPVQLNMLETWERRYLPARDFGSLILSTPQGVMTHQEAKEKKIGGVLLAYVY